MVSSLDDLGRLNLKHVLDSLPDGVTFATASGRIVFSNAAADRILGVGAATEATPDEWAEHYGVFEGDGATPFPTEEYPLVRALSGEVTTDVEMVVRNAALPEGAIISVSGRPLTDAGGRVIGAGVVFRDITALRRAQRSRDELASFIIHDLKSPLSAILVTSELLLTGVSRSDEAQADVRAIHSAALRMKGMVTDLLDVQMAEDGALELSLAAVPVFPLFERVVDAVRPHLAEREQTIELEEVPQVSVQADESHLFRVLANLIDNCLKYGPAGGVIRLGARGTPGGAVVIHVSDEGPGVPPHLRERIFDKYAQMERDEGRRSSESRGLGLRYCKVVTEAHGAKIWVEDAEPRGARFCLELASSPEAF